MTVTFTKMTFIHAANRSSDNRNTVWNTKNKNKVT